MLKQSRKKASKGLHFIIVSDQRPHPSAAKSWSQCSSPHNKEVSHGFNVDCIPTSGVAQLCSMPWKRPFLWHSRFNRLHLQVKRHATNQKSMGGGHNRRRLAGGGAKRPPPKGGQFKMHGRCSIRYSSGISLVWKMLTGTWSCITVPA